MKMKIKVKRRDIWFGKKYSARGCPIARAIYRETGQSAYVAGGNVQFTGRFIPLPLEAKIFIHDFDGGRAVKPFSFELELP